MNKIERKRVKRARAKLSQQIVALERQLASTQRALITEKATRQHAVAELEEWRQKLQAIHYHTAILPPEHNPRYAGPKYLEPTRAVLDEDLTVRTVSRPFLTMAELYLEMHRDILKRQRYFHFTAIPPKSATRRMAYCVSEEMWNLLRDDQQARVAFERDVLRTMYHRILQLRD